MLEHSVDRVSIVRTSETELVSRLKAAPRSESAWADFYRRMFPPVYYCVYRRLGGDSSAAQDLTQDAFTRFVQYGAIQAVKDDDHALAYLRQTARRLCADYQRSSSPVVSLEVVDQRSQQLVTDGGDADMADLFIDLERLAGLLNESDADLLLGLIEGKSLEDLAKALNVTYGAVAVRLHRLRKKFMSLKQEVTNSL